MNAPAAPAVQREPFVWSTTAKLMTLAVLAYSVWVLAQIDITPERLAIGLKQGCRRRRSGRMPGPGAGRRWPCCACWPPCWAWR